MISCDTSLPRRLYEARRVSTASSLNRPKAVGLDIKSKTDFLERGLRFKIKKNRISTPKPCDQGRQKRGSTLIYYFIVFENTTESATLISQSPDSHYLRLAQDLPIRYSFLSSIISKRNKKVKLFYHQSYIFLSQINLTAPICAPWNTKRKTATLTNSGLIIFLSYECNYSII